MLLLLVDIVIRGCCCRQTYKPDGSFKFIKYTTFSKLFKFSEKTVPENCAYAARATTKTFSVCVCVFCCCCCCSLLAALTCTSCTCSSSFCLPNNLLPLFGIAPFNLMCLIRRHNCFSQQLLAGILKWDVPPLTYVCLNLYLIHLQICLGWWRTTSAGIHARLSHWHHTEDLRGGPGPGRETLPGAATVHAQQELGEE